VWQPDPLDERACIAAARYDNETREWTLRYSSRPLGQVGMVTHSLPKLPYALDGLAPHVSPETLEYHWGKHHRGYVDTSLGQARAVDVVSK
jgi:hypothetical protein